MDSTHSTTSPTVKPFFGEKLKKALFHLLLAGSAAFALLAPVLTYAGFSIAGFIESLTAQTQAASSKLNSQTVPLLSPATNINPSGNTGGGDIATVAGSALLPQEGPSGTAAEISERPESSQISVYVVHKGDTLSTIAEMFDVSVNTIKWANDLQNGTIREGQTLVILPVTGVRYTVQKGDSIASLAKKYKADAEEIAKYNDLTVGQSLAVGASIIIPDGEISAPKPVQTTARTSSGTTSVLRGASGPALSGYFGWPVDGGVITQGLHGYNGVDIGAPRGTGILASADGTVLISRGGGAWNGGYGNYIVIQHDNGTQTLYAHASALYVSAGQRVTKGSVIAAVGMTGKATGNHLHFEVRGATNPFGR